MLNYDAMGNGLIVIGALIIAMIVVLFVFVSSAIILGILLHKKRKENKAQQSVTNTGGAPKED